MFTSKLESQPLKLPDDFVCRWLEYPWCYHCHYSFFTIQTIIIHRFSIFSQNFWGVFLLIDWWIRLIGHPPW